MAWVRAHPYRSAMVGYVVLAALFLHDWDGYVFATAVRQLWDGQTPYQVASEDPWYGFLNVADRHVQWYAYPPLPLLTMAASYAPAVFADLPPFVGRILLKLPAIVGTLALARVGRGWAERLGASAQEQSAIERRFLANPLMILVGSVWGMTDTMLMALYMGGLLALGNRRPWLAGVLVAAAALVKPFPILLVVAIAPYLLRRDGWRSFARFAAAGAATVLVVCLPFALRDPAGFWRQSVAAHLARDPQGLTLWSVWPLDLLPNDVIAVASLTLMAAALLLLGIAARRMSGKGTTLTLTLAAAAAILVTNRVVNEQYLVLVVAPMLVLDVAHRLDKWEHRLTRWTPNFFAAAIVLVGFHFLTFIPPDIALPIFGRPVDEVAFYVRQPAPWLWSGIAKFFAYAIPITMVLLSVMAARLVLRSLRTPEPTGEPAAALAAPMRPLRRRDLAPTVGACILLAVLAFQPLVGSAAGPPLAFSPAFDAPRVAAFYYLWWNNPAHDPAVRYGNWDIVSQVPEMGYYTSTRGVMREHARSMVQQGIDTAIVSYHRGEQERYRVFQEEASAAGLWVAPLIELNQIYDQPAFHPVDDKGVPVPYAAYRLTNGTRDAIERFVVDLKDSLRDPSTLRMPTARCPGGCPVVYFYDSYVSGISFQDADKRSLAQTLLATVPLDEIRAAFNDSALPGTVEAVLAYHPPTIGEFYAPGAAAVWRRAHLAQHVGFWGDLRTRLEAELGPLYMVGGDAFNGGAAFDTGVVKSLVGLEVFDASFIYSPSFTWFSQTEAPFDDTFSLWEDRNHWLTAFTRGLGAGSSFGIAPAYDDIENRGARGFAIPAFPTGADGPSFYELGWASARGQTATLPAVATFNEFFEGSSIEASREYGDRFLQDTATERARLVEQSSPARNVFVVTHEQSSRTSLEYSETDLSHFWGLDLLAAVPRAVPDAAVSAFDALGPDAPPPQSPDLLLIEGGRGQFGASAALLGRVAAWVDAQTPLIIFGPDVAQAMNPVLGDNCLAGLDEIPDPKTLAPGDRLRGEPGALWLDRGGQTYRVGQTCDGGLHAGTRAKPWVATDPPNDAWGGSRDALNARCLAVTLLALQPGFAAPDAPTECVVS